MSNTMLMDTACLRLTLAIVLLNCCCGALQLHQESNVSHDTPMLVSTKQVNQNESVNSQMRTVDNTKVISFRQSWNESTSDYFLTVEVEALNDVTLSAPCVQIAVNFSGTTNMQNGVVCKEWDDKRMKIKIPHVEFSKKMEKHFLITITEKENGDQIYVSMIYFNASSISASVTVVGAEDPSNDGSHLRVNAMDFPQGVPVGSETCKSICYYNYNVGDSALRQQNVATDKEYDIIQIDDRIIPFSALSNVKLDLTEDGLLEVRLTNNSAQTMEAVVYDDQAKTINFEEYACQTAKVSSTEDYVCHLSFSSRGLEKYWVLVVALNADDVVIGSTWMNVLNINVPTDKEVQGWVILVSVLVSVFAIAFIIGAVLVVLRKKKVKKEESLLNNAQVNNVSSDATKTRNQRGTPSSPIYQAVNDQHRGYYEPVYDAWGNRTLGNNRQTTNNIPQVQRPASRGAPYRTNRPTSRY